MASDKQQYEVQRYKDRIKDLREAYQERKEYIASFELPFTEEQQVEQESEESTGNAVEDDTDVIGSFQGSGELVTPAEHKGYRYTSKFQESRNGRKHWGADLAPPVPNASGCKILSAGDGVIIRAGYVGYGFENAITIKHKDNLYTTYGHMPLSSIRVKEGETVKKGQWIADMGAEGNSQGVHLHFEVHVDYNRRYQTGGTVDPEKFIDLRSSAISIGSNAQSINNLRIMTEVHQDTLVYDGEGEMMHGEHDHIVELTDEQKRLDRLFSSTYPYLEVRADKGILRWRERSRKEFIAIRIGWGRSTKFKNFVSLDKQRFIHHPHYDGHEGNLYSPDAKRVFEDLLLKTKKPYFEIISGFRFSENKQLSPHEAGCAMDILVKSVEEAREIADCAWQLGIRSIGIGGDFTRGKGFLHVDICPKGKKFMYDGVPIYGGPGKWEMR